MSIAHNKFIFDVDGTLTPSRGIIDEEFKYQLDLTDRHYLTVTGSPLQRVDQILKYIK